MREACLAWVYVRDVVFGAEWFVYIAAIGDADIFSGIEVELRAALYHAKSLATDFAELKVIYPAIKPTHRFLLRHCPDMQATRMGIFESADKLILRHRIVVSTSRNKLEAITQVLMLPAGHSLGRRIAIRDAMVLE